MPSGRFGANSAWVLCAAITHNLLRAAGTLAGTAHAVARGATLRRKIVNIPARLARPQRRPVLHLPRHWPWAHAWLRLWHNTIATALTRAATRPPTRDNRKSWADQRLPHAPTAKEQQPRRQAPHDAPRQGQGSWLSGSERVYARHQWCRRLDMASDQCGVGVSGLWWVSDILRGMSLDGLVAQVGQVLGDARGLYGAAPQGGGWSSTQALSAGRDGIAEAGGVVAGWGGAASSTHLAASGGRVLALDNVIGADGATGSGFGGAADASQSGRNGMTGVVDDTRRGVAAIAPSTDTAAGKRQLVDHLQLELDRAKSLLKVSEQRNVMLAQLIRGGAAGYGGAGSRMGGGMSPMMGGGMGCHP